jgi:hypothetical protein
MVGVPGTILAQQSLLISCIARSREDEQFNQTRLSSFGIIMSDKTNTGLDYCDWNEYEWSYIWIPIFLNILALIFLSYWWKSLKRINGFRQLRQVGICVRGFVRSSRVVETQHDGQIQYSYYLTVIFPVYFQMPGDQNFSSESTEGVNSHEVPRRIHGLATKEYRVSSNVYSIALRVHEIEMVFDPSAPEGLAAPAYLLNTPALLGVFCSAIWLLTPTVFFSLFGVKCLPQCAPLHTGPCAVFWLAGYFGPILIMILCHGICKRIPVCTSSDLEFEMETLNEDAIPVEAI